MTTTQFRKSALIATVVVLGTAAPALAAFPATIELHHPNKVNTLYTGEQGPVSICVQPDGTTVFAWQDDGNGTGLDGSGSGIQVQRVRVDGTYAGTEFTANTFTLGFQTDPQVACAANGDFVVVWVAGGDVDGPDGSYEGIAARRFNADGTPKGGEFVVNSTTLDYQYYPDVCSFPDGGFVAIWMDESAYIWARRFDATGAAVGLEFGVDAGSLYESYDPTIGCAGDGRFVAAWYSAEDDGEVLVQPYDATGTATGPYFNASDVPEGEQGLFADYFDDPIDIAVAADGRFVVAWTDYNYEDDYNKIKARRFAANGTPLGASVEVSYDDPLDEPYRFDVSVAIEATGAFGVGYNESGYYGAPGQLLSTFHADGTRTGTPGGISRNGEYDFGGHPSIASVGGGAYALGYAAAIFSEDDSYEIFLTFGGGNMCGAVPATSCRVTPAGASKLQVTDTDKFGKDKIKWSWKKGEMTPVSALGDPIDGISRYEFCLYDGSASEQPLMAGLAPPDKGSPFPPDWKASGTKGFKFTGHGSEYNGYFAKMSAKSGEAGKASVQVQAGGQGHDAAPMIPFTGPVVAQLMVHGDNGIECWQTTFTTLERNDEEKVQAVGP